MANSRLRGATFEREIVNALRDALGVECKRNLDQWRDGGDDIKLAPYSIECKRRAKIALYEWWEQATKSAGDRLRPVLMIRADRKQTLVVMDFEEFVRLAREEIVSESRQSS
jgi:hypothetical protein